MPINLYNHQQEALDKLKNGSILCGGVGSGKSRTALAYYFLKECGGEMKINGVGEYSRMKNPKDLYIITTARKRDTLEWELECIPFLLSTNIVIDSWNNIGKYKNIKNAFFIFDEQRVVGSGTWVKSFIKITKNNRWILLSATPGDTWMDYVPVFIANGFYKNRTEFTIKHVVYNRFTKYPKIDHYIECAQLIKCRDKILVNMPYSKPTTRHDKIITVKHDKDLMNRAIKDRWNVFKNKPIRDISELCYLLRGIANTDKSRVRALTNILTDNPRVIVFYNFNYELEILRTLSEDLSIPTAEWNGHKHEPIPKTTNWLYLVQYTAGAEGWNCVETNCMVFYSLNYSYKVMEQAAGRIDRLNTPYKDLYYYHLRSNSDIDLAIAKALNKKKKFNQNKFIDF